ncbi:MAG: hypothetical protein Q4B28_01240 [bacterium]|nr:hypothetical protein [bacterium]
MIIGVDIDEVLSETLDYVLAYHNYQIKGLPLQRQDMVEYYIPSVPGFEQIEKQDAVSFFTDGMLDPHRGEGLQPVEGARAVLEKAKEAGHRLIAITARGPLVQEATLAWMQEYYGDLFDEVVFCNYHDSSYPQQTKQEVCHNRGVEVMVDDNLHYARDLAKAGIPVYLIDRPWNQQYRPESDLGIKKVVSRAEIDFAVLPAFGV